MNTTNFKAAVLTILITVFLGAGVSQSSTLASYDSQFTSTEIEYEFSGLPADTELAIQEQLDDGSTNNIKTFTTSPSGSAVVNWVHTPFKQDSPDMLLDETGWNYQVVNPSTGNVEHSFGVKHGNMLFGLDTFDDLYINPELWTATATRADSEITKVEESSHLLIDNNRDCANGCNPGVAIGMQKSVAKDEILYFDGTSSGDGRYDTRSENPGSVSLGTTPTHEFSNISQDILTTTLNTYKLDNPAYEHQILYNQSTGAWEVWQVSDTSSTKLASEPSTAEEVYMTLHHSQGGENARASAQMNSVSIIPKSSEEVFSSPTRFDVSGDFTTSGFKIGENATSGIQFQSSKSTDWSVQLPALTDYLDYRVNSDGELNQLAVNTDSGSSAVEFNLIAPNNGSATVIPDGTNLQQELQWEWLYQINDGNFLTIATVLTNLDTGNTVDQNVYTSYQAPIVEPFSRNVTLPPGTYEWYNELTDSDTGEQYTNTVYFEVVEESNASASFNLINPSDGATVNLTSGRYEFDYSVTADSGGNVDLYIPQESAQPVYTQTIDVNSSTQDISTSIPLEYEQLYDWYLEYSTTFTDTEPATDIVFEDFENGDVGGWSTDGSDTITATTSPSNGLIQGDYAAKYTHNGEMSPYNFRYLDASEQGQYDEFSFWATTDSSSGSSAQDHITIGDSSGTEAIAVVLQGSSGSGVYVNPGGNNIQLTSNTPDGQWYRFEITNVDYSAETFDIAVYDEAGAEVASKTGLSFWRSINEFGGYAIGNVAPSGNPSFYVDELTYRDSSAVQETSVNITYQSQTNSFSTTGIEFDSDPDGNETDTGTGDDGTGDGQIVNFGESWFQALSALGFEGMSAELITGTLISLFTAAIAFNFAGVPGGVGGLMMGILISGIVGLYPSWMVFSIIVITGAIVARWGRSVLGS